ncbi:MAG TPA: alpha-2-macroglobulin family protein, partial [Humisphaera sp.]
GAGEAPAAAPRSNFADTALWAASVTTNAAGEATVSLDMPENLTTWKAKVFSLSAGTRVGQGDAEVTTFKDLIVRLQAPRFFVEKDEVVLSANVHNYKAETKDVKVTLDLPGGELELVPGLGITGGQVLGDDWRREVGVKRIPAPPTRTVRIAANGEKRIDWRVKVVKPGTAVVRMSASTDTDSDGMESKFPVYIHGTLKTDSFSGALRPADKSGTISFTVPAERLPEQSRVEVRYSPSVAAAMVDALPYLVDFPYGCTEQTLNRFLPTVVTQRVLLNMGLDLRDVQQKRTNLNAQEIGDDAKRAADWKRNNPTRDGKERNPVFDVATVQAMTRDGVNRLTNMQNADGGWGWFSGFGEQSYPHTTALVVHGLQIARENDVAIVPGVIERGVQWLKRYQQQQVNLLNRFPAKVSPYKEFADDLDAFVYMVLTDAGTDRNAAKNADEMREFLYRDRVHLSVYTKAMFGLALQKQLPQQREKLDMVLQNIGQYVVNDDENQTSYLKMPEGNRWWYWYGSDVEADAYYLKLLAHTDPKGATAPRLAKYLINNRKHATYWNSTRDTAIAVEALADYIKGSGEDKPDMTVRLLVDGKPAKEVKVTAATLFTFDNKLVIEGPAVTAGRHTIEVQKEGTGPLYYNAYVTNFTLEDPIKKAGLEVRVDRKFYKLNRVKKAVKVEGGRGQAVDQQVEAYERQELKDLSTLASGDLVEVELEIDSKNDYEYLIFEDYKPAGFEPVEVRSGYNGNDLNAYVEFRDERVAFFARTLARGKHSVSYRLRAEIPGKFSALPTKASAMYAPELRGNSDEFKVNIVDAPKKDAKPAAGAE